jgi:hypothetical protein
MGASFSTIDYDTDMFPNINQHLQLGAGGFGSVFADRTDSTKAYKLVFSTTGCEKAKREAEIQNDAANSLNNILAQLPVPVHIPFIIGYNQRTIRFNSIEYNCIIGMERVPLFNQDINCAYQLGMEVQGEKEHPSDEGIKKYTELRDCRGIFITESNLLDLAAKYSFNVDDVAFSWGFAVCSLIFIAKNDINDLEYILSANVSLQIIDFGLSQELDIVDEATIDLIWEHIDLDVVLPSPANETIYPHFIRGMEAFKTTFPSYPVDYLIEKWNTK